MATVSYEAFESNEGNTDMADKKKKKKKRPYTGEALKVRLKGGY